MVNTYMYIYIYIGEKALISVMKIITDPYFYFECEEIILKRCLKSLKMFTLFFLNYFYSAKMI